MSDEQRYPSQLAERFQIRMPDGLRDRIRVAADKSGRSMNAEIVQALETYYPPEPTAEELLDSLRHVSTLARMQMPDWKWGLLNALTDLAVYLENQEVDALDRAGKALLESKKKAGSE